MNYMVSNIDKVSYILSEFCPVVGVRARIIGVMRADAAFDVFDVHQCEIISHCNCLLYIIYTHRIQQLKIP